MRSSLWIPVFTPSLVGVYGAICPMLSSPVLAQITPDNTLGSEGSIVLPDQTIKDLPADLIQGGATRGSNLFHSFLEFNVNEGQRVYFDNPSGIDRILSRVTGSDVSDILGTLGVNGGADLFFLNPNGIVFGGGTRLDLGGSFVATTARGVQFQDYEFSTVNPDAPPLLNINLPIGLQMGQNPGSLRMLGGSSSADFSFSVPAQKTLSLLAGSILVEDLQVVSPNSVIQLGALAEPGLVGLGEDLRFAFPEGVERGDITLQNRAVFDTRGTGGDRISVNARNLLVQNASALWTGIAKLSVGILPSLGIDIVTTENTDILNFSQLSTASFGVGNGGTLSITAREVFIGGLGSELPPNQPDDPEFPSDPFLYTIVTSASGVTATGNAGDILIDANALFVEDGALFSSITWGSGDAGDINITLKDLLRMRGLDQNGGPVTIASGVSRGANGSGGTIRIQTRELSGKDGANIITNTYSSGDAGRIEIQAETITLAGEHGFGGTTGIYSQIRSEGDGTPRKSRGISIETRSLLLLDGAQVNTSVFIRSGLGEFGVGADRESTFSVGDAGPIDINASEKIILSGQNSGNHPEGFRGSRIASQIRLQGVGNASPVRITTPFLSLSDYGEIVADTLGAGSASSIFINASDGLILNENTAISVETSGSGAPGNIEITTPDLTIAKDARISATVTETSTYQGDSGNITLNISNIDLSGKLGIFAETNSIARAGDLTIQPTATDSNLSIRFRDDGFISASTTASGDGGSISLTAPQTIDIAGAGRIAVTTSGSGNAGLIDLTAPTINLQDGVTLSGSTRGSGQGGTIVIQARDSLNLNTATIEALTTEGSSGNGGDIFIDPITTNLNDSRIILDSAGTGIGGNLQLTSNFLHLDNSSISAQTRSSDGGSLTLNIPKLLTLQHNSVISTQAGTAEAGGNGGNITINANLIVGSSNSDIIANAFEGNGGNINIFTQGLFGFTVENTNTPRTNSTNDITASSQFGVSSTPNISQALDPSQSLAVLDANVADLSNQIDRHCDLAYAPNASRFVILGKGGIPATARDLLSYAPLFTDLDLSSSSVNLNSTLHESIPESIPEENVTVPLIFSPDSGRSSLTPKDPLYISRAIGLTQFLDNRCSN